MPLSPVSLWRFPPFLVRSVGSRGLEAGPSLLAGVLGAWLSRDRRLSSGPAHAPGHPPVKHCRCE